MSSEAPSGKELRSKMLQMATAKFVTKPLYVAARLGIADLLAEGPCTVAALAAITHTHAPSLQRLLRALASVGVFAVDNDGMFCATALSELIRQREGSLRPLILWMNDPRHDHVWEALLECIETGRPAPEAMLGRSIWEYLMCTPDLQQLFNEAMTANARVMHAAAIRAYDFSGIRRLVDVGGGQGALLCQILAAHPEMGGILLERPETVPAAQAYLRQAGLAERCEVVGGDFFHDVPGGDAHIMSHVLHDWEDDQALAILAACYRSGAPRGRDCWWWRW